MWAGGRTTFFRLNKWLRTYLDSTGWNSRSMSISKSITSPVAVLLPFSKVHKTGHVATLGSIRWGGGENTGSVNHQVMFPPYPVAGLCCLCGFHVNQLFMYVPLSPSSIIWYQSTMRSKQQVLQSTVPYPGPWVCPLPAKRPNSGSGVPSSSLMFHKSYIQIYLTQLTVIAWQWL